MTTLSQHTMKTALNLVRAVAEQSKETQQIYGNLCHDFPVLVRTCGLCQAIAFCADKAHSDEKARAQAYRLLLQHVGEVLGIETNGKGGPEDELLTAILKADATSYMLYTRRVLHAWVYFKRFAVSVLDVETGGGN